MSFDEHSLPSVEEKQQANEVICLLSSNEKEKQPDKVKSGVGEQEIISIGSSDSDSVELFESLKKPKVEVSL